MKTKILLIATMLFFSTSAFAQFSRGKVSSSSNEQGWNSLQASYIMMKYSGFMGDYDVAYNGCAVGYNRAISLTEKVPIYFEIGGAIQYAGQSIEESTKNNLISINIPVSVLYKWKLFDTDWSLEPKVGFDGRINIVGKGKNTYYGYHDIKTTMKYNMFKGSDDIGNGLNGYGDKCSRFQLGWHIGANIGYKRILVGVTYGTDITNFCKEYNESTSIRFKTLTVSVGYKF